MSHTERNDYVLSALRARSARTDSANPAKAAFEEFANQYDHESDEWLDMGADALFEAGFAAALCVSGRHSQSEDALAAEGEACQSDGERLREKIKRLNGLLQECRDYFANHPHYDGEDTNWLDTRIEDEMEQR